MTAKLAARFTYDQETNTYRAQGLTSTTAEELSRPIHTRYRITAAKKKEDRSWTVILTPEQYATVSGVPFNYHEGDGMTVAEGAGPSINLMQKSFGAEVKAGGADANSGDAPTPAPGGVRMLGLGDGADGEGPPAAAGFTGAGDAPKPEGEGLSDEESPDGNIDKEKPKPRMSSVFTQVDGKQWVARVPTELGQKIAFNLLMLPGSNYNWNQKGDEALFIINRRTLENFKNNPDLDVELTPEEAIHAVQEASRESASERILRTRIPAGASAASVAG